jgi:hypothetical protein
MSDRDNNLNQSFCVKPWISLALRTYGGLSVCPHMSYQIHHPHISEIDPKDFRESPSVIKIKQNMLAGIAIPACQGCKLSDVYNRINCDLVNEIQSENFIQSKQIQYLRLDFSNKCNLMCPTCGIHGSSNWEKVIREKSPNQFSHMTFDWAQKINWTENPFELLNDVIDLTFSGGEPLLMKECHQILEKAITIGRSSQITLNFISNATIDPSEYLKYWSHFKHINIWLSIDAIGARYNFLRNPSTWDSILEKVHSYLSLPDFVSIKILQSVSIFNFFHMVDFVSWVNETQKIFPQKKIEIRMSPIENPSYFSISSFSDQNKIEALKFLSANRDYIPSSERRSLKEALDLKLNEQRNEMLFKRKIFMKEFSLHAQYDLKTTFPELITEI